MKERIPLGWAGIDVGKAHHWVCLLDDAGTTVWSTKVANDEATILDAVGGVLARADEVVWGVDVTGTMSGLLLALLAAHGQSVRYVPGRTVNQMAGAYRGEAKTNARDAYVIAETLRHRGDLQEVEVATSLVTELQLLVTHRTDLVGDRVRMVNRLRDVLSGYFPTLEAGVRLRPQPWRSDPADRLPDPAGDPPDRRVPVAGPADQAEGPQRGPDRSNCPGRGQGPAGEAGIGPRTRPGAHRAGPSTRRRPLGATPRPPTLRTRPTYPKPVAPNGLTKSLRIHRSVSVAGWRGNTKMPL